MHNPDQNNNNSLSPRILIFDSGVGALSVFAEINKLTPQVHCTLALDNAHFPYGTLNETVLLERVVTVVGDLIAQTRPELAIIACNTASTLVLDELRRAYDIPFVGVVPAIKPAAKISKSQSIGLLATPATIERSYIDNLIEDFAPDSTIVRLGSSELVYMAEQKMRGQSIDSEQLARILAPFIDHPDLDTLVLACTHFPLLAEEIEALLPSHIQLLDSGAAIAQRVSSLLQLQTGQQLNQVEPHRLVLTQSDTALDALTQSYQNLGIEQIEVVEL